MLRKHAQNAVASLINKQVNQQTFIFDSFPFHLQNSC